MGFLFNFKVKTGKIVAKVWIQLLNNGQSAEPTVSKTEESGYNYHIKWNHPTLNFFSVYNTTLAKLFLQFKWELTKGKIWVKALGHRVLFVGCALAIWMSLSTGEEQG